MENSTNHSKEYNKCLYYINNNLSNVKNNIRDFNYVINVDIMVLYRDPYDESKGSVKWRGHIIKFNDSTEPIMLYNYIEKRMDELEEERKSDDRRSSLEDFYNLPESDIPSENVTLYNYIDLTECIMNIDRLVSISSDMYSTAESHSVPRCIEHYLIHNLGYDKDSAETLSMSLLSIYVRGL